MTLLNKSIGKAFEVIESFEKVDKRELTISEISEITDISISTAYRMATSLVSLGYLNKNTDEKTYSLGWKILKLLSTVSAITESALVKTGARYVTALSEQFNENASLYVKAHKKRLCLYRVEGTQDVRNIVKAGDMAMITLGSPGKVLLAFLPESGWDMYFPSSDTAFAEELRAIRARGYAATEGEQTPGASSISAPVFGYNHEIIAALVLSGPSFRFTSDTVAAKVSAVVSYAGQISAAFTAGS